MLCGLASLWQPGSAASERPSTSLSMPSLHWNADEEEDDVPPPQVTSTESDDVLFAAFVSPVAATVALIAMVEEHVWVCGTVRYTRKLMS